MSHLLPRGFRNHNPLNIRHSSAKWVGLAPKQTDKSFCQFTSDAYGYRAAFVILRTYFTKYDCNTISKIISRWAPRNENNTTLYINKVSEISNIPKDKPIKLTDSITMTAIVSAMTIIENGIAEVNVPDIKSGYRLAFHP